MLLALLLVACGGTGQEDPPGDDRAVWPASATRLVADESGWGFVPALPPVEVCARPAHYDYTVADGKVSWGVCRYRGDRDQPWAFDRGERILDEAQRARLRSALGQVVLSSSTSCGADKGALALIVTTPAGERRYEDSFYACMSHGPYVDHIDGVFEALESFTH